MERECKRLGVPLALEKKAGPSPILTFLGIEVDTIMGQLRLPTDKLQRLISMVTAPIRGFLFIVRYFVTFSCIRSTVMLVCGVIGMPEAVPPDYKNLPVGHSVHASYVRPPRATGVFITPSFTIGAGRHSAHSLPAAVPLQSPPACHPSYPL